MECFMYDDFKPLLFIEHSVINEDLVAIGCTLRVAPALTLPPKTDNLECPYLAGDFYSVLTNGFCHSDILLAFSHDSHYNSISLINKDENYEVTNKC